MTSATETSVSQFSPDMSAFSPRIGGTRSRTQSISSDRPSTVAQSVMSPPLSVSPEAAFIASPSASQIVTNDHDNHADTWYDQHGFQPSGESVVVSNAALHLLNNFLDHLLFNFLARSGSTSLANLRPAVSEVLKPKLAKDAINNADEELREYLGGGDDDEFLESPTAPAASPRDWDLELVWKRTRLRCMVYSSLGDMEEEDEDHHMEEGLLGQDDDATGSNVSPAVAIFLTSILEYLGEQALVSAGQVAWNRMRIKYEKEAKLNPKSRTDVIERIVVEEFDMERVALDRTLGRLWRAWKKRVRSGNGSVDLSQQPVSREKMYRQRLGSLASADGAVPPAVHESTNEAEEGADAKQKDAAPPTDLNEAEAAAAIPLPLTKRDVDEIEVPGMVHYSDDDASEYEPEEVDTSARPKSMMDFAFSKNSASPSAAMTSTPRAAPRRRASSLPPPPASLREKRKKSTAQNDAPETETSHGVDGAVEAEDGAPQNADEKAAVAGLTTDEAVSGHSTGEGNKDEADETQAKDKPNEFVQATGMIAAAAAAVSSAVAAPVLAASKKLGESHDDEEDGGDTDIEEIEEAQIMTSSRISIGGSTSARSDSPASSDRGSRPPLSIHLPVRSGSLRVVDVASPRTPSSRSQRSSLLQEPNNPPSYSRSVSRTSSIHVEEPREAEDTRGSRVVSGVSSVSKARNSVAPSISEAEEIGEPSPMSATIFPRRELGPIRTASENDKSEQQQQQQQPYRQQNPAILATIKRPSPSSPQRSPTGELDQRQPPRSAQAIVTTVNTPPDSATFMEDAVGPLPPRYTRPRQYSAGVSPVGPAVPEKSASRYQHAPPNSTGAQAGTIGILSVDRPAANKENSEAVRSSPEQVQVRPSHTPASSTSSHKMRMARASQDSTATQPEAVARNFEELIRGNETIQYTLTPENVRELEGSPRSLQSATQGKARRSEDARQATRDRAGSSSAKPIEVRRSTSVSRATGLRSHPVDLPAAEATDKARPPLSMANKARGPGPQARDARLGRESILEFAEFIRATGPPPGAEVTPVQPNMGLRRNQSLKRDVPSPASHKAGADQPRPSMTSSIGRARLQARDATVDSANDNSDLIDFIRRGPPSAGNHRIPRTVAPFRTTMDSDQMVTAIGGRAVDTSLPDAHDMRGSQASTNVTEMSAPSVQSSVNSQSALLGRKPLPAQMSNQFDEPDMMPVRKQHRVRDPYAIDLSDEEEEEEEEDDFDYEPQPKRKAPPKEESLMDFLNSAPPPPPSAPVPFNLPRTQSMPAQAAPAPKKKASAPSLMARFRQNSAAVTSRGSKNTSSSRSLSSRAGPPAGPPVNKGYIPIQVNIPTGGDLFPSYSSNTAPAVPNIPAQYAQQRPSGRVPMKKFEPRDAVSVPSRGTSDLADFLRSEPPPLSGPTPWNMAQDEGNSSNKLFGRRKKSTGFA